MKSPIDIIKGRIVDYDEMTGELIIRARYDDDFILTKRQYAECLIQLLDGRKLSVQQRRAVYALIREVSDWSGYGLERTKSELKKSFLESADGKGLADEEFSLSDVEMSTAAAFHRWLVRFIVDYDVPTKVPLINLVDDIPDYIYACATRKKCCICGQPADLHHHKRIGMGRNRAEIDHEGLTMEPLCRLHHAECHMMPQAEFDEKYHIMPIVINAEIKELWNLTGDALRYDEMDMQYAGVSPEE